MNLVDIFEADKEPSKNDTQRISVRDPLARRILDKARAKYAYTETDLEAFVKLMQDEQAKDRKEINDLEDISADLEKHEEELEHNIAREHRINQIQAKQLTNQRGDITDLEAEKESFHNTRADYRLRMKDLEDELSALEGQFAGIKRPEF
jgi:chromosome segregation ATPase